MAVSGRNRSHTWLFISNQEGKDMISRANRLKTWRYLFPVLAFVVVAGLLLFGGQASAQLPVTADPAMAGVAGDLGAKATTPVVADSPGTNNTGGQSSVM